MTTVREDFGQGPDGTGEGQPGQPDAGTPRPQAPRRWRPTLAPLSGLVRRHWLFSLALLAAAVPRLVVMLGYRPAMLFRLDTFDYLWGAVHLSPNVVNPSGYSLFLWLLLPFHSLVLVAALQHLLGLGVATMVYAVLRHYRLPAWGATLAASAGPVRPGTDHDRAPDHGGPAGHGADGRLVRGAAVPRFAVAVALGDGGPDDGRRHGHPPHRPAAGPADPGLPAHQAGRLAPGGRRPGRRHVLPVLGYMSWFAAVHGTFNLSNSNGLFLWSRTMSFANCSVIKPPPDLQALCPTAQPGPLASADPALRRLPKRYLWNHRIWAWQGTTSGFVPDTAAFTQANNERALRFAVLAIKAQPVAYAQTIAAGVRRAVRPHRQHAAVPRGPAELVHPGPAYNLRYAIGTIKAYTGSDQGVSRYLGYHFGVRVVHVPAVLMNKYQHLIFLPGPVFGLIMLTGLVGIIIPSRRSWPAIFLWVSAVIIMVLPTAEHEYTYRYVIPAVPLLCIAAALAFRKQDRKAAPEAAPGGSLVASGPGRVHRPRQLLRPFPGHKLLPVQQAAPGTQAAPATGPAAPAASQRTAQAGPAARRRPPSPRRRPNPQHRRQAQRRAYGPEAEPQHRTVLGRAYGAGRTPSTGRARRGRGADRTPARPGRSA